LLPWLDGQRTIHIRFSASVFVDRDADFAVSTTRWSPHAGWTSLLPSDGWTMQRVGRPRSSLLQEDDVNGTSGLGSCPGDGSAKLFDRGRDPRTVPFANRTPCGFRLASRSFPAASPPTDQSHSENL